MVVKLRPALGVAMIWLAAVAGVSVTSWFAIDRAGRDVTGATLSSLPAATVVPAATITASHRSGTDSTPGPSGTSEPSGIPSPAASTTSEARPSPPPSSLTPGSAAPRDRTISISGGQVSVRCTGDTILLRIAQPDNGYRVEFEKSGDSVVKVSFRRGDDEGAAGSQVTAVCDTGTPAFTVASES